MRMRRLLRRHYGEVILAPGPRAGERDRADPRAISPAISTPCAKSLAHRRHGVPAVGMAGLTEHPARRDPELRRPRRDIGAPTAVRAVGLANGANPVALVAPCHRVIGADGSLTGFGGGLPRKRWLLRHEGARFVDRATA